MASWYALRARNELKVRDALADRGFFGYVPMERVERRLGRRLRPVERAVWRGYVFVLCGPEDEAPILAIEGAYDFVRSAILAPVTLALNALDEIIAAEWSGALDYVPHVYIAQRGDHVRIRSGKWKSYLGRVLSLNKSKALMEFDKGPGKINVELTALEPAPEPQAEAA
jgi:transcription antitermination factor NusG